MKTIYSLIFAVIFSVSALAQKSADLSYNLELNKVYRVKSTAVQNTNQTVMGNEQSSQTSNTVVMSLKPLKKLDGEIIAEVRFDTIHTVISQPPMDINSAREGDIKSNDPGKVMESIMHRMANSTFLVKLTNTGRVVEFMNLAPTINSILQGTDSIQGPAGGFIKQRAEMMVEEKSLKSMIEMVTAYLPGEEVKTGDKWEINIMLYGGGFGMSQNGTYKLVSLDKNSGVITADLVVKSEPGTMDMNGAQITPNIEGIGKTEMTIDTETGWVIKGTYKQQLKGDVQVNAQGQNMTIPTEINTTGDIIALP